jgi:hypothetical protein
MKLAVWQKLSCSVDRTQYIQRRNARHAVVSVDLIAATSSNAQAHVVLAMLIECKQVRSRWKLNSEFGTNNGSGTRKRFSCHRFVFVSSPSLSGASFVTRQQQHSKCYVALVASRMSRDPMDGCGLPPAQCPGGQHGSCKGVAPAPLPSSEYQLAVLALCVTGGQLSRQLHGCPLSAAVRMLHFSM